MVEVNLRDHSSIINLTVVGKAPIRGRVAPSPFFHSPLELLLSALGLCIGGQIKEYCRTYDLNPLIFEQVLVDYDGSYYRVTILRPRNLDPDHMFRLRDQIKNCNVARELKKEIVFEWKLNTLPVEELKERKPTPCCGSK